MPSSPQAELKSPREAALWLARQALAMQQEVVHLLVVEKIFWCKENCVLTWSQRDLDEAQEDELYPSFLNEWKPILEPFSPVHYPLALCWLCRLWDQNIPMHWMESYCWPSVAWIWVASRTGSFPPLQPMSPQPITSPWSLPQEASAAARFSFRVRRRNFGPRHPRTLSAAVILAAACAKRRRTRQAVFWKHSEMPCWSNVGNISVMEYGRLPSKMSKCKVIFRVPNRKGPFGHTSVEAKQLLRGALCVLFKDCDVARLFLLHVVTMTSTRMLTIISFACGSFE